MNRPVAVFFIYNKAHILSLKAQLRTTHETIKAHDRGAKLNGFP